MSKEISPNGLNRNSIKIQKTKAEKIASLKRKNQVLEDEVKDKEEHLKEYIELFKKKAEGQLSKKQIAKVIEAVENMQSDDESSQSDSDSDLEP